MADGKSTGRPPIMDDAMAERLRGWLPKPPKDFGFKSVRWHPGMVQEKLRDEGIASLDGRVRRCMPASASRSASRGRPPASLPQRRGALSKNCGVVLITRAM